MLMEERIYTEALITKSISEGMWETDENGNPIIIIEASNENLDYDGERVLRSALLNSKKGFLQNGVISYDHKHIANKSNFEWDPAWNAEKYILGKPLDAWEGTGQDGKPAVKVKAVLYKSNNIAKEIVGKLQDNIGTVKASVGGRKVRKAIKMDVSTYRDVPTIVGVDWDEVALTYKPVNQTLGATTLCPKEFVKSLTVGNSVDPGNMGTGGNTLQMQSLEGSAVRSLFEKMRFGEITNDKDAITHLVKSGYSTEKAGKVLKVMINKYLGDVVMAKDANANEVIDNATDELEKALKDLEESGSDMSKAKKDGKFVRKGGFEYMKKADGKYEKMDEDAPDYEDDEDDDEDEMGKSIDGVVDVTEDIVMLKKSIAVLREDNADMKSILKSISENLVLNSNLTKAIGNKVKEDAEMLKSISKTPLPRQTNVGNLEVIPRFEKSQVEKLATVTSESMVKSMVENHVDAITQNVANIAFRRGGIQGVIAECPDVAKILVKG